LIFFFNQRYFLYSLFVFYPLIAQCVDVNLDLPGQAINMSQLYGSVVFCLILFALAVNFKAKGIFLLSLALFVYFLCTALFSPHPFTTMMASMKFGSWVLLIPLASSLIKTESDIKLLSDFAYVTVCIIIISIILSWFGIYGRSTEYGYQGHNLKVAIGAYYNQSGIAAALLLAIPILFIKGFQGEKRYRYQIGALIAFVGILMTYVRGPFAIIILSYFYLLYLSFRHSLKRVAPTILTTIFVSFIAISAFYFLNPETAFLRWKMEQNLVQDKNIAKLGSGRVGDLMFFSHYYMNKMDALQKTFGIGFGIDGYINPTGKIAHNTFLQVLIGCGLVGILLFIVFVMGIFIMYKKFIIKQTSLNYRLFCTFGIMSWFVLILLLLRGGGAQIFPYFMSSIQIGATIGLIINSRDGEIAASSKYR